MIVPLCLVKEKSHTPPSSNIYTANKMALLMKEISVILGENYVKTLCVDSTTRRSCGWRCDWLLHSVFHGRAGSVCTHCTGVLIILFNYSFLSCIAFFVEEKNSFFLSGFVLWGPSSSSCLFVLTCRRGWVSAPQLSTVVGRGDLDV